MGHYTPPLTHPRSVRADLPCSRAVQPWSPGSHFLYGPPFRRGVLLVLVLANRLEIDRQDLPRLPAEIWLLVISFFQRRDFPSVLL